MKNRIRRWMIIVGTAAFMGMNTWGCGGAGSTETGGQTKEEAGEQSNEEQNKGGQDGGDAVPGTSEDTGAGTEPSGQDNVQQEHITGDIEELKGDSLVLNRYYEETLSDGTQLMASPAEGADTEKDLVTVFFDEDTRYSHLTIYDGGERSEETESSLKELKTGMEIRVDGRQQEDGFYSTKIQIIEVVY